MFLNMKKLYKISAEMLRDYFVFDSQIKNLKEQIEFQTSDKDINSTIKSKNKVSNKVENEVIRKIMIENKINQIMIWKDVIFNVIEGYKKTYRPKYDYIIEKFMNRKNDKDIEDELFMSTTTQYRYKTEIVYQIAIIAISKNLIILSEVIDNDISCTEKNKH